uniref:Uncharacterized protein n=1 Tax=Sphaerodactylus townsendi TaxID=933632 RepID=A0ACB8GF14_9SAUR
MICSSPGNLFEFLLHGSVGDFHISSLSIGACHSDNALQLMTRRCHGKRTCSVYASTYEFGDPCYPVGIPKHLNVIYTCGRGRLTSEVFRGSIFELVSLILEAVPSEKGPPGLGKSSRLA